MRRTAYLTPLAVALLTALIAGCGGDDNTAAPATAATTTPVTTTTATTAAQTTAAPPPDPTIVATTTPPTTEAPPSSTPATSAPVVTVPLDPALHSPSISQVVPFDLTALDPQAPPGPLFLASGGGSLWAALHRASAISRVDPTTGAVLATLAIDPVPDSLDLVEPAATGAGTGSGSIAATDDTVWVLDGAGFAWGLDLASTTVRVRVDIPDLMAEGGVLEVHGKVWVRTTTGFAGFDPDSGELFGPFPIDLPTDGNGPFIVATDDALWLPSAAGVVRADPATGAIEAVIDVEPLGVGGFPIGTSDGLVWAVRPLKVWAIDPATNAIVSEIQIPPEQGLDFLRADSATVADGVLWAVTPAADGLAVDPFMRLVRVDLAAGTVTSAALFAPTDDFIVGLAAAGPDLWLTDFSRETLLRVPMR